MRVHVPYSYVLFFLPAFCINSYINPSNKVPSDWRIRKTMCHHDLKIDILRKGRDTLTFSTTLGCNSNYACMFDRSN